MIILLPVALSVLISFQDAIFHRAEAPVPVATQAQWQQELQRQLTRAVRVPPDLRKVVPSGRYEAHLAFTINPDGTVSNVFLAQASGNDAMDVHGGRKTSLSCVRPGNAQDAPKGRAADDVHA
ncbi:TonB C-terminal domain-containing protein [Paracoccus siganidrum]|uniref:Uncharacterized protein n=1 Tax=Paracoccus siganidrum TaxID=1276757 RepID=A0A419A4C8_9RHOB|nr:TonB C-terminal domain-containing protein [Paracoccus siganidrum]RJL09147.1 hypothetical protein D3P05_15240 [Paracoccus siganidrum]RMC26537.1 hypothetical protein C9E82_22500 [Paracoccus siganidrum]